MAKTFTAGRPGGFAMRLALRFHVQAVAAFAFAVGCGYLTVRHVEQLSAGGVTAVLTGAAAAGVPLGLLAAKALRARAGRAAVGARSERQVAASLARLSPVALLHSVDLAAGGDADHLVCGPKLVVVETKTGSGVVSYDDGVLFVNRRPMRGNPIAQCRRQATAARDVFGVFCDAIVCVVDMVNAPFTVSSVHVCSLNDLPSVYTSLTERVRSDQAWARAVELAPRCSTVHAKTSRPPAQAGRPSTTRETPPQTRHTEHRAHRDPTPQTRPETNTNQLRFRARPLQPKPPDRHN